jgi:hypothetical protein
MNNLQDYKEVSYNSFQEIMDETLSGSGLKDIEIAYKIGVKSSATVKNAFRKEGQVVSDEVMTHIMKVIGLDGFILWNNSKRKYFIKK